MIIAAADVKPMITGWEIKLTRKPRRNKPNESCTTPINNPVNMTKDMYSETKGQPYGERCVFMF